MPRAIRCLFLHILASNDDPHTFSHTRPLGAARWRRLAATQRSTPAGVSAAQPRRRGRPALVRKELSRRVHLLYPPQPHASIVTDLFILGAQAQSARREVRPDARVRPRGEIARDDGLL